MQCVMREQGLVSDCAENIPNILCLLSNYVYLHFHKHFANMSLAQIKEKCRFNIINKL